MDANEAIRLMIKASGKSGRQVAREIGRSESFISSSLAQGLCPRADTLARIADACGYDLVAVPKNAAEKPMITQPSVIIDYDGDHMAKEGPTDS